MTTKRAVTLFATVLFAALFSIQAIAQDQVIKEGRWISKGYRISGGFSIVQTDRGTKIVLDQRFSTTNGPDLKIFLSRDAHGRVHDRNADNGKRIAVLESNRGYQEYWIPPNVNISQYKTLIIHCERFSKLWGVADITPDKGS